MKKLAPFLLLIILFAGAAWYSFTRQPDQVHELPPAYEPPAMQVVKEQPEPAAVIEEEAVTVTIEPDPVTVPDPLLPLNESDPQITQSLADLTGADPLAEYLVKSNVISRIVVTIDSLISRQVPGQINPIKPADKKLIVDEVGESITLSAQNYARYDGYVALLQNTDSEALIALYQRYYPLFQQAWEENGGEGPFNDRLAEVIDNLLETPDIPGPIYLTKPEAVYVFEDPDLESMTAGQKILIRMGSANASVVKENLMTIKGGLSL